jgi:hypothetical protein
LPRSLFVAAHSQEIPFIYKEIREQRHQMRCGDLLQGSGGRSVAAAV